MRPQSQAVQTLKYNQQRIRAIYYIIFKVGLLFSFFKNNQL